MEQKETSKLIQKVADNKLAMIRFLQILPIETNSKAETTNHGFCSDSDLHAHFLHLQIVYDNTPDMNIKRNHFTGVGKGNEALLVGSFYSHWK